MAAPFNDLAIFQYHNGIGVANGGEPVGNDKNRPSFHKLIHALFNVSFCAGIDRTGGFIQYQHRWIRYRCPGNGNELPLSLGKIGAIRCQNCVISLGQM